MVRWEWDGLVARLINPSVLVACGLLGANPSKAKGKKHTCVCHVFGPLVATLRFCITACTPIGTPAGNDPAEVLRGGGGF